MNDGLPDTSYLKMIDIWLFFNLLVPFILIIIHTYMETLRSFVFLRAYLWFIFFKDIGYTEKAMTISCLKPAVRSATSP